jgi:hypothetical protein
MPENQTPTPNQALKLTRRAACLLGGRASAHNLAVLCSCISPAVQLSAGVGPLVVVASGRLK